MEQERIAEMYETTNQTYGSGLYMTPNPGRTMSSTGTRGSTRTLPKDKNSMALVQNPAHPCGIMSMSNVPTNTRGEFTNVFKDFHADRQGLWCNASFNTPGATIERGVGTYSNLQGGWARIGPSTYDATHGHGAWAHQWAGTCSYEPATLRSLYDHRNVDPRDNCVPIDNRPQNM